MIKKQSLWFLTLFSLILVLSVYYITMPNELFLTNKDNNTEETTSTEVNETVTETDVLTTMRIELDEKREELSNTLEKTLNDSKSTTEDKNTAYEQLRLLTDLKGQEASLEKKIKKDFKYDSFIKIEDDQVMVVIVNKTHDAAAANKIMRSIQEEFSTKMYVSVKFES